MKIQSDKKRVFYNTVIVTGATILDKFIFFIINILIARYLNINHFGEFATALGYATFFSLFTNIGINHALIRAINLESELEKEHFANALLLKTIFAISVYSLMVISLFFTNYNTDTIYLTLIFGLVRIGTEYLLAFYALYDAKEKFFIVQEEHCLGTQEERQWTIEAWLENEGLHEYNAMNDQWLEIITSSKGLGSGNDVTRKIQMFFMASYNLDTFRSFLFNSPFFDRFHVDSGVKEKIASDDKALMLFAFDWLKFSLFGENTLQINA